MSETQGEIIELRPALKWFAEEMERVLRQNDHKKKIKTDRLFRNLVDEVFELNAELLNVNTIKPSISPYWLRRSALKEAVDVANYAMMIAHNLR